LSVVDSGPPIGDKLAIDVLTYADSVSIHHLQIKPNRKAKKTKSSNALAGDAWANAGARVF